MRVVAMVCAGDGATVHGPVDVGDGEAEPTEASDAVVAALPGGGFVVAYFSEMVSDLSRYVHARWFDAVAQPASDVVEVRAGGANPSVGVNSSTGQALIAWVEEQDTGSGLENEIMGRVYDSSGEAVTEAFDLSHDEIWNEWSPKVAASNEEFVVTWYGDPAPESGKIVAAISRTREIPSDPEAIWATVVDVTGGLLVEPSELNIGSMNQVADPAVAVVPTGFAFGWSYGSDFDASTTYVGLFSDDFAPIGDGFTALGDAFDRNGLPRIVALGEDAFLTIWYTASDVSDEADSVNTLEAAVFGADGDVVGKFHVAGSALMSPGPGFGVAPLGDDEALIATVIRSNDGETRQLTLIHCVWSNEPGCEPEL